MERHNNPSSTIKTPHQPTQAHLDTFIHAINIMSSRLDPHHLAQDLLAILPSLLHLSAHDSLLHAPRIYETLNPKTHKTQDSKPQTPNPTILHKTIPLIPSPALPSIPDLLPFDSSTTPYTPDPSTPHSTLAAARNYFQTFTLEHLHTLSERATCIHHARLFMPIPQRPYLHDSTATSLLKTLPKLYTRLLPYWDSYYDWLCTFAFQNSYSFRDPVYGPYTPTRPPTIGTKTWTTPIPHTHTILIYFSWILAHIATYLPSAPRTNLISVLFKLLASTQFFLSN